MKFLLILKPHSNCIPPLEDFGVPLETTIFIHILYFLFKVSWKWLAVNIQAHKEGCAWTFYEADTQGLLSTFDQRPPPLHPSLRLSVK